MNEDDRDLLVADQFARHAAQDEFEGTRASIAADDKGIGTMLRDEPLHGVGRATLAGGDRMDLDPKAVPGEVTRDVAAGHGLASLIVFDLALLQTWGTAARRHPVGGLGSIGEMLIEHNHGFGQGRGSNSECSFNQAHLPHDTWLQAPCLGLSFA